MSESTNGSLTTTSKHTPSGWRKRKAAGETVTTPSGLKLVVRRLSLLEMVLTGGIPAPLLPKADELLSKTVSPRKAFEEFREVIELQIKAAVISPQVVDEDVPADDETRIGMKELDADDKLAIFNTLNSSPSILLPFLDNATT